MERGTSDLSALEYAVRGLPDDDYIYECRDSTSAGLLDKSQDFLYDALFAEQSVDAAARPASLFGQSMLDPLAELRRAPESGLDEEYGAIDMTADLLPCTEKAPPMRMQGSFLPLIATGRTLAPEETVVQDDAELLQLEESEIPEASKALTVPAKPETWRHDDVDDMPFYEGAIHSSATRSRWRRTDASSTVPVVKEASRHATDAALPAHGVRKVAAFQASSSTSASAEDDVAAVFASEYKMRRCMASTTIGEVSSRPRLREKRAVLPGKMREASLVKSTSGRKLSDVEVYALRGLGDRSMIFPSSVDISSKKKNMKKKVPMSPDADDEPTPVPQYEPSIAADTVYKLTGMPSDVQSRSQPFAARPRPRLRPVVTAKRAPPIPESAVGVWPFARRSASAVPVPPVAPDIQSLSKTAAMEAPLMPRPPPTMSRSAVFAMRRPTASVAPPPPPTARRRPTVPVPQEQSLQSPVAVSDEAVNLSMTSSADTARAALFEALVPQSAAFVTSQGSFKGTRRGRFGSEAVYGAAPSVCWADIASDGEHVGSRPVHEIGSIVERGLVSASLSAPQRESLPQARPGMRETERALVLSEKEESESIASLDKRKLASGGKRPPVLRCCKMSVPRSSIPSPPLSASSSARSTSFEESASLALGASPVSAAAFKKRLCATRFVDKDILLQQSTSAQLPAAKPSRLVTQSDRGNSIQLF